MTFFTINSFIWLCYPFSVHSVLFIVLKIVLLVWVKNHHCGSFIDCRIREWTIFNDFLSMTNKCILDNSRFYTEVSFCFVWLYRTYAIAMTFLTRCWHMLTVISSFFFMTRVLFKRNSYSIHRISKEWKFWFSLNVFYIRCNKSQDSINHYKYLNLLCTYTILP